MRCHKKALPDARKRDPLPLSHCPAGLFSLFVITDSVLFDLRLERLTGKEDATLDRSQGDVQRVSDLIVMIAANVHGEGHTQLVVQLADSLRDLLQSTGTLGCLDARFGSGLEVVEVDVLLHDRLRAQHTAVVIDEDVPHHGQHPTLEVAVVRILLQIVQDTERSFLRQIHRIFAIGREGERKVHHVVLQTQ